MNQKAPADHRSASPSEPKRRQVVEALEELCEEDSYSPDLVDAQTVRSKADAEVGNMSGLTSPGCPESTTPPRRLAKKPFNGGS